ncbi:MAG: amidohydrolase, partial [Firmicutes bacterium]|nr:amidohydrolase [Bacillota bacterium]
MKIENVKIYTMDPALGVIPCGFIEFDAGKITAVGACEGDGSGGILFPGFIDGHTHLGLSEDSLTFEGDDLNEGTDPITPQLRAIDAINPLDRTFTEAREAGITCVAAAPGSANPIGGQIAVLKTAGKRVDDMIIAAPAAMKFALGENPKGVYHEKNQTPETRMATAALMREQLFKAKKYAEALDKYEKQRQEYLDNPDENDEPSEPEFDFKSEALLPVIRREIPVHFHAHRADDIFTAIRIAKEFHLRYTIVHC